MSRMTITSNYMVTDEYRDRVLMISNNSDEFIEGQLELINTFGFRLCFYKFKYDPLIILHDKKL